MTTIKENLQASDYNFNRNNTGGLRAKSEILSVDEFLLAQAAVSGDSKPVEPAGRSVVRPTLEVTPVKPEQPGPAEAIGTNLKDVFQNLNDMDLRAKQGLKDFATRKTPSGLADGPDGANPDSPLAGVIKSMEALLENQKENLRALMAIQEAQSNAGMVTTMLKAGKSTFDKLTSG